MSDILDVQTAAESGSAFTLVYVMLMAFVYQKTFISGLIGNSFMNPAISFHLIDRC